MSHTDDGQLHTYLDGELAPDEEAGLREHLATCADCRGRLDAERVTRTRAHEILRFADPARIDQPDFATVLARRSAGAGAANAPRRGAPIRPLLLPWAASVVLAVGAGWFAQELMRGGGGGDGEALGDRVATFQAEESRSAPEAAPAPPPSVGEDRAAGTGAAAGAGTDAVDAGGAADASAAGEAVESGGRAPTPSPGPLAVRSTSAVADRAGEAAEADRAADDGGAAAAGDADAAAAVGAVAARERRAEERQVALEEIVVTGGVDAERRGVAMQAEAASPAAPPPPPPALSPEAQPWPQSWRVADASGAAAALGQPLRVVGGLRVVAYHVAADGTPAVRVTQRLPDGSLLELLQLRAPSAAYAPARAAEPPARELLFTDSGVRMLLRAAVSADSLERLRQGLVTPP